MGLQHTEDYGTNRDGQQEHSRGSDNVFRRGIMAQRGVVVGLELRGGGCLVDYGSRDGAFWVGGADFNGDVGHVLDVMDRHVGDFLDMGDDLRRLVVGGYGSGGDIFSRMSGNE